MLYSDEANRLGLSTTPEFDVPDREDGLYPHLVALIVSPKA